MENGVLRLIQFKDIFYAFVIVTIIVVLGLKTNGQLVANGNLPKQKLQHQIKTPQQAGMYYLQLISDNQLVKVIPFIVE